MRHRTVVTLAAAALGSEIKQSSEQCSKQSVPHSMQQLPRRSVQALTPRIPTAAAVPESLRWVVQYQWEQLLVPPAC